MGTIDVHANSQPALAGQALKQLTAQVREAHAGVVAAFGNAIEHAVAAGQALRAAKPQVAHGQWLAFLKGCDLNPRTAQRYMQLAELAPANASSATHLADLSIERAVKRLSQPALPPGSTLPPPVPPPRKTGPVPSAKTTHGDVVAAWMGAPPEERARAVDSIGLEPLWAAIPPPWLPLIERRIAAQHRAVARSTVPIPDDLSIPVFLKREQPKAPAIHGGGQ